MGNSGSIDDVRSLEEDFANLARIATGDAPEDVRLLLAKLVRKYRTRRPELAERINESLRQGQQRSTRTSVLRRAPNEAAASLLPVDADSRLSLVRIFDDRAGLPPPLLADSLLQQLQAIVRERHERSKLAKLDIHPTRSAILVGPPGVGKTLSARWIAAQIGKPLWVLDLTTVMSSLLGKTGNNLRLVFDHARDQEAVLLLDEIDSIAKRRSDESDVGELKRLVTAILQEIDAWPDSGLLLAATNHPELVDPALWRRFESILHFEMTDPAVLEPAVRRFLGSASSSFEALIPLLAASLRGHSLSDVERTVNALKRRAALEGTATRGAILEMAAQRVSSLDKAERQQLAIELARSQLLSHNQIMSLTGVARDTIRKYAGPSPIKGRGRRKGA